MRSVYRAMKAGGYFFLTVPQHGCLWSTQDEGAGLKQRYTKAELIAKLIRSAFLVDYVTSFCCALFRLMFISRLKSQSFRKEDRAAAALAEFQVPARLNQVLRIAMRLDELRIAGGWKLPLVAHYRRDQESHCLKFLTLAGGGLPFLVPRIANIRKEFEALSAIAQISAASSPAEWRLQDY